MFAFRDMSESIYFSDYATSFALSKFVPLWIPTNITERIHCRLHTVRPIIDIKLLHLDHRDRHSIQMYVYSRSQT